MNSQTPAKQINTTSVNARLRSDLSKSRKASIKMDLLNKIFSVYNGYKRELTNFMF